ncbi:MAG TPA: hypothetical protein VK460_06615 [Burkholderiales bacterium]|nr:hypothetical protein [Burkholderiales bacterium]
MVRHKAALDSSAEHAAIIRHANFWAWPNYATVFKNTDVSDVNIRPCCPSRKLRWWVGKSSVMLLQNSKCSV